MESRRKVVAGETLLGIAHDVYGDARLFHVIAKANGIAAPYDIGVGDLLVIPPPLTPWPIQPYSVQVLDKKLSERGNQGGRFSDVPEGKMLIIEDVAVEIYITRNHQITFVVQVDSPDSSDRAFYHWVPLVSKLSGSTTSREDILVGGRTVRWYAGPGATIYWYAQGESGDIPSKGGVSATVSGHYIDLE